MFQLSLVLLLALLLSINLPGVPALETLLLLTTLLSLTFPLASLLSLASSINPFVVGVLSGLLLICSYRCFIPGIPIIATVESLATFPTVVDVSFATGWVPFPTSLFLPTSFCM
jgi:hypothetical protein